MTEIAQLHRLFQSENLQELVNRGRELIVNPIILSDLTHRVLAISTEPELRDPKWREISETCVLPINHGITSIYHQSMESHRPIMDVHAAEGMGILRVAISHSGQLIGFIEVPCYYAVPSQEDEDFICLLADIACLIMKRDMGYMDSPSNLREFFISDLMEGRLQDETLIRERFRFFNWKIPECFQIISISGKKGTPAPNQEQMELHLSQLQKIFPSAITFAYGNRLKLLVPIREDTISDGLFYNDIISYLQGHDLQGGISRSCDQLKKAAKCDEESNKALEMGQILKSDEVLFFYDKYSVYHALEVCAGQLDLMQFCHSGIFTLAEYDRAHETALLETLHAYLYCGHNMADAAAKLFVHRNTLNTRLAKIDDLIHVDLKDSETSFHLMFSFHILEYYASTVALDYETRIRQSPTLKHQ